MPASSDPYHLPFLKVLSRCTGNFRAQLPSLPLPPFRVLWPMLVITDHTWVRYGERSGAIGAQRSNHCIPVLTMSISLEA